MVRGQDQPHAGRGHAERQARRHLPHPGEQPARLLCLLCGVSAGPPWGVDRGGETPRADPAPAPAGWTATRSTASSTAQPAALALPSPTICMAPSRSWCCTTSVHPWCSTMMRCPSHWRTQCERLGQGPRHLLPAEAGPRRPGRSRPARPDFPSGSSQEAEEPKIHSGPASGGHRLLGHKVPGSGFPCHTLPRATYPVSNCPVPKPHPARFCTVHCYLIATT